MKKRVHSSVCVILTLVLAVAMITPAFAANTRKQITVEYGISLKFNNELRKLVDVNGNEVVPFAYQGTTYVPIRGVSYLFGAGVDYDAATDTALIYDDFSEICATVNKMDDIITEAYQLLSTEMLGIALTELEDYSSNYQSIANDIDSMFTTLYTLGEDNGNTTIIINEVLPEYSSFIQSFANTHNAYNTLRKSQSSYNVNQFVNNMHVSINTYYAANNAVNDFFKNYCTWRDIGF